MCRQLVRELEREPSGAPLLDPLSVLHQGHDVAIVDLRPAEDARGAFGCIPGSVFVGADRLDEFVRDVPDDVLVILVSQNGRSAARAALRLEQAGRGRVAAMAGGLVHWRRLGFGTSRDRAAVRRCWEPPGRRPPVERGLSIDEVHAHVGAPEYVRWVKLASMATHASFSCIDGRDEHGVIGTPGGDAGEFLLEMAAVERTTGERLTERAVARALLDRIDTFGTFARHSDARTFADFADHVRGDARVGGAVGETTAGTYEFLRHPPVAMREALLEHLVRPDHVGCGHVRLMLTRSEEYGIRRELVEAFLRAFYVLWWEGAPELTLAVLPGGHAEHAVVNVRLDEELWTMSRVPLISPRCAGRQVFVNHPEVARFLRESVVEFHVRGGATLRVDDGDALRANMAALADQQLRSTLRHLAPDLPIYDLVFARDGSYDVRVSAG